MKQFVYQMGVRKADNKLKKFRIESDYIITERKLTLEDLQEMSNVGKCDIKIDLIGSLIPPKREENLEVSFYTKEQIEEIVKVWSREPIHYDDPDFENKMKEYEEFANGKSEA